MVWAVTTYTWCIETIASINKDDILLFSDTENKGKTHSYKGKNAKGNFDQTVCRRCMNCVNNLNMYSTSLHIGLHFSARSVCNDIWDDCAKEVFKCEETCNLCSGTEPSLPL